MLVRVVSGIGSVTVMSAEGAALHAAQVFALADHIVWSKLRAARLNLWIGLRHADKKMQQRLEVDKKLWQPSQTAAAAWTLLSICIWLLHILVATVKRKAYWFTTNIARISIQSVLS